jgi:hypothetical protein
VNASASGTTTDYDWRERKLSQQLKRKWDLEDQGRCTDCGEPGLSEWYCMDCLGKRSIFG